MGLALSCYLHCVGRGVLGRLEGERVGTVGNGVGVGTICNEKRWKGRLAC